MQFHPDARLIIKRATQTALCQRARSVGVEHLLECDLSLADSFAGREIDFSPEARQVLGLAGEQAGHEFSSIVRRGHLELALLIVTARLPDWSEFSTPSPDGLMKLLFAAARRGLKLTEGVKGLLGLSLPGEGLRLGQVENPRFLGYARRYDQGMTSSSLLILLLYVLSEGQVGQILRNNGVTEARLVETLEGRQTPSVPSVEVTRIELPSPKVVNFSACLGSGIERFSEEARTTLGLAWLLRDSQELRGRDLLRALIASSSQLEDRNIHSLLGSLRPGNQFVKDLDTVVPRKRIEEPVFSAEAYRVIHFAMGDGKHEVTNLDLLIGLAECGEELLRAEGITAAEIRRRWTESF